MARQIIVLERRPDGFGAMSVTAVFWIPVTAAFVPPGQFYGMKWDGTTWTA